MKTITAVALMTLGLAASGMAAEFTGFVMDTTCSIYKVTNQDKILASAGQNVTVTGKLKGDMLTIDTVK